MTQEQFESLVRRTEQLAAQRPAAYRRRVLLLALLGYAYIAGVLLALLLIVALIVGGMVALQRSPSVFASWIIAALGLAYTVVRSLWVRLPPPEGIELRRDQAPALFALLEELRRALAAPRVHRVLLTGDFNAAVAQHPRLGVLGWDQNVLLLGVPLLHALSPEQLKATLAHELGHLAGRHGRFGAWIYRIRAAWSQLLSALAHKRHRAAFIFERFFEWYAPYFAAYTFVLARAREYEADRSAAALTGPHALAEALTAAAVGGRLLDESFWPALAKRAAQQPEPPAPYDELPAALRQGSAGTQTQRWIRQALRATTGIADTHPSLAERLAALGRQVPDIEPPATSAADVYLASVTPEVTRTLNRDWQRDARAAWHERHTMARGLRQRLDALEQKAQRGDALGDDERWQRAVWTAELQDDAAALPLFQDVLEVAPDHAGAHFAVGRILLSEDDLSGADHIRRAMTLDEDAILPGCEHLYEAYVRAGKHAEAERVRQEALARATLLEEASTERGHVSPDDVLLPHGLSEAAIAQLRGQLTRYRAVGRAHLVRKQVTRFTDTDLFVLVVLPRGRPLWERHQPPAMDNATLAELLTQEISLPGDRLVVVGDAALDRRARTIPGAEIVRR